MSNWDDTRHTKKRHCWLVRSSPVKTRSTSKGKHSPQSNKNEIKACTYFICISDIWLNNVPLKPNNICICIILFFLSKVQYMMIVFEKTVKDLLCADRLIFHKSLAYNNLTSRKCYDHPWEGLKEIIELLSKLCSCEDRTNTSTFLFKENKISKPQISSSIY